jgi:hypothetical protein
MTTTIMQELADAQSSPEPILNENFETLGALALFGLHQPSTPIGLTLGLYGGRWNSNTVGAAYGSTDTLHVTLALTDATTNYVVANRSTGALSTSTATTNWNDTTTYGRVRKVVTVSGAMTDHEDWRYQPGGIFDFSAASVSGVSSVNGESGAVTLDAADVGAIATSALDTDGTMAANSAAKVPAQSAVVTYVNTVVNGRSWKNAVRAATTANGTLASAFANGQTVDGVTLATGDRILLKNQTTGSENGIYTVNASGAPTRALDADSGAELVNASCYVSEGTTNADTQWTCTTNAPITVGSTSTTWVQSGSGSTYSADGTTLQLSGTTFSVKDDGVANAKLANMATQTIKGRTTAGTGDPEDLTAAQAAAIVQGDGLTVDLAGFRGIPQNSQSAAYTLVAADAGKHIYHPSSDANARTFTIPANSSVAFPIGTAVTFVNETSQVVSIAITTDTLVLAGAGTTGTRSLAQYGVATAIKVTSTRWIISGTGLT